MSVLLSATAAFGAMGKGSNAETKTPWKVAGELEEACSCHPACPCWFKSLPSRMTCDGAQVIFITKGKYGSTPLDGLAASSFKARNTKACSIIR
jgi:hypothetical protein